MSVLAQSEGSDEVVLSVKVVVSNLQHIGKGGNLQCN